jgi:hypothetical protein
MQAGRTFKDMAPESVREMARRGLLLIDADPALLAAGLREGGSLDFLDDEQVEEVARRLMAEIGPEIRMLVEEKARQAIATFVADRAELFQEVVGEVYAPGPRG